MVKTIPPNTDTRELKLTTSNSIARRHDLDALRAIAMLLGIALHGALAYMAIPEGGWPVQDSHQSSVFAVFMSAVHGFRMPLFFLISGFFTAMLWRKRGLKALIEHRAKRILLPLVIGMFTIVPAVWIVSIGAGIVASNDAKPEAVTIWSAAKDGNLDQLTSLVSDGASVDERDPGENTTPLSMAARHGQTEAVQFLIDAGADVNAKNGDGSRPIHNAAFFGRAESVRVLVENGADTQVRDGQGYTPAEGLKADWITTSFVAGIVGMKLDRAELDAGRKEVGEILRAAAPTGTESAPAEATKDGPTGREAINGILLMLWYFPFYHHLWFLSFLCWFVAAFAIYALVANRLNWKAPAWLVVSPLRYAWLIPLTIVPQTMMGIMFPTFGPDTSAGILPMPQVLLYYAIFFFFGAMYFDSDDETGRVGRWWPITIPIALFVVFPLGYDLTFGGLGLATTWIDESWHRSAAVVLQVVYAWLMTFGLMGCFRSLLSKESRAMRYISDSSYWLYLAHLPVIIVAQAMVRNWDMNPFAKCTIVCVGTSVLLLISYQLFVRYTPIGTLLNGPRERPKPIVDAVLAEPTPAEAN